MIEERLLICLRGRASHRGIVPVRGDALAEEVGAPKEEVGAALDKLERAGLLTILAPSPFLVLRLTSWSGMRAKPAVSPAPAYSYSKLSSNPANEIKSYRPTSDDALLREILDTLGETDPTTFEGAIKNFSPDVIRKALDRVRRTKSLRKNRTALFRYLLTKLS
jgi:hypothetical protein